MNIYYSSRTILVQQVKVFPRNEVRVRHQHPENLWYTLYYKHPGRLLDFDSKMLLGSEKIAWGQPSSQNLKSLLINGPSKRAMNCSWKVNRLKNRIEDLVPDLGPKLPKLKFVFQRILLQCRKSAAWFLPQAENGPWRLPSCFSISFLP